MSTDIKQACDAVGGQLALAQMLGVTAAAVSQWVSGLRQTPPDRCPAIERATDGRVNCEALRPDVRWVRVPDAQWPHPQGRPLIDVAADTQAAA